MRVGDLVKVKLGTTSAIIREVKNLDNGVGMVIGTWSSPDQLGGDVYYSVLIGGRRVDFWQDELEMIDGSG
jgi:hypothetical protein